jgi:3-oxoadipate enol-lactonase
MTAFTILTDDGTRLAGRIDGPTGRPAVLLANSLGTDHRMWDPQIPVLSERLRVIRFDTRGHGRSDVPPGPYTIERLGRDLLAILDGLTIERAHLCGLSLGGMVVLWVAALHPQRVDRAVFANTAARIGTAKGWEERIATVRGGAMQAVRDLVVARFLAEPFRTSNPEVVRWVGDMVEATPPTGYIGSCAALGDADLHGLVRTIQLPSLVIGGDLDESTPAHQARELHTAIAGSELIILKGAGHLSNVERPDEFSHALLSFLTRP